MSARETPLVSICICAYNAAAYIEAALTSAARQTYGKLEILVVDDASVDATPLIVDQWSQRDPKVKLLRLDQNRGIAHARQTALEAASGAWVVFLDADDLMHPEMVERQLAAAQEDPSLIAVGVAATLTGPEGPTQPLAVRRIGPSSKAHFRRLFDQGKLIFMETPSLVSRRSALEAGGFRLFSSRRDGAVRIRDLAEDLDLWCRVSDAGRDGKYMIALSEPLAYIRKTAGSLSSANSGLMAMRIAWVKDCLRRRRRGLPELGFDEFEGSLRGYRRWRYHRTAIAARHWRALGSAYVDRRWPTVAWRLLVLLLLEPGRVVRAPLARARRTRRTEEC